MRFKEIVIVKATSHYLIHKANCQGCAQHRQAGMDGRMFVCMDGRMDEQTISDEPIGFGSDLLDRYRL